MLHVCDLRMALVHDSPSTRGTYQRGHHPSQPASTSRRYAQRNTPTNNTRPYRSPPFHTLLHVNPTPNHTQTRSHVPILRQRSASPQPPPRGIPSSHATYTSQNNEYSPIHSRATHCTPWHVPRADSGSLNTAKAEFKLQKDRQRCADSMQRCDAPASAVYPDSLSPVTSRTRICCFDICPYERCRSSRAECVFDSGTGVLSAAVCMMNPSVEAEGWIWWGTCGRLCV